MKNSKIKAILLLIFVILTYYLLGIHFSYFLGQYTAWKQVGPEEFVAFYQHQSDIMYNLVFIPAVIMTVLNLVLLVFRPSYVNIGFLILSAIFTGLMWACSYYWQTPVLEELSKARSIALISDLEKTETIRFAAQAVQVLCVTFMLGKILLQLSSRKR